MDTESYWKQFMSSGKVEDYLSYSGVRLEARTQTRQESARDKTEQEQTKQEQVTHEKQKGERPYAGSDYGDRNGIKSDAYR